MKASEWIEVRKQHLFAKAEKSGRHIGFKTASANWYKDQAVLDYLDAFFRGQVGQDANIEPPDEIVFQTNDQIRDAALAVIANHTDDYDKTATLMVALLAKLSPEQVYSLFRFKATRFLSTEQMQAFHDATR